jgi:hypothetical protein
MSVRVSGKHMEIGESFRGRIEDRITDAVKKYFDGGYSSQGDGREIRGRAIRRTARFTSIPALCCRRRAKVRTRREPSKARPKRIEKRLRRYKRRLKDHHAGNGHMPQPGDEVAYRVMDGGLDEEDEIPEDYAPVIVAESSKVLRTMSVASAVMALDLTDDPVLIFRNAGNGELNVVYRRSDGNIGWVDAASTKS